MLVTPSERRLLIDECVPRPLVRELAELQPKTVQQLGWAGTKNGRLLALAAEQFDVLFTVDQDFAGLAEIVPHPIGVVILQAGSTDFEALLPHIAAVKAAIEEVPRGTVRRLLR
jgi:predicted nuclease of predicted toxin-antitoxin system